MHHCFLTLLSPQAEKGDIDEILAQFDVLDVDKSGTLTFQDLQTPATM